VHHSLLPRVLHNLPINPPRDKHHRTYLTKITHFQCLFYYAYSQNWENRPLASSSLSVSSVRPSVRVEQLGSHLTDMHKIWYLGIFRKLLRTFKFHSNTTRITGTSHEDQHTFLIISRSVFLRMGNVSDKSWRGNQNTHFMFSNFLSKHRAVYEIT